MATFRTKNFITRRHAERSLVGFETSPRMAAAKRIASGDMVIGEPELDLKKRQYFSIDHADGRYLVHEPDAV